VTQLTTALLIGGMHLSRLIQKQFEPPKCRWCNKEIAGSPSRTACCDTKLCQPCKPQWQVAGGTNCVYCNKTK
jgi:hypothetical protein